MATFARMVNSFSSIRRAARPTVLAVGTLAAVVGLGCALKGWTRGSAHTVSLAAAACTTRAWSAPRELVTSTGNRLYTERPDILRIGNELVLVGSASLELDTMGVPVMRTVRGGTGSDSASLQVALGSGLALSPTEARLLPLPPGTASMAAPRTVLVGDTLHVMWGVSKDTATHPGRVTRQWTPDSAPPPNNYSLWYAQYRAGVWTTPAALRDLPDPNWNRWETGDIVSGAGALHVVVPESWIPGAVAVYFRRDAGRWTSTLISMHTGAIGYARLAVETDGTLLLAFITAGTSADIRWNHVHTARSFDHGVTWTEPVEVGMPWHGPAYDLQMVVTDSARYLAWIERPMRLPSQHDLDDSIRVITQARRDSTWQPGGSLPVPFDSNGLQVALGSDATLYAVVNEGSGSGRLIIGTWRDGRWRGADRPALPAAIASPSLAMLPGDSLVMVWGLPRQSAAGISPQGVIAISTPTCPRRDPEVPDRR